MNKLDAWWRFAVHSTLRYRWVWIAGDYAAASVWVPPGRGDDDSERKEADLLVRNLLGAHASAVLDLFDLYDAARPTSVPHYYLNLLCAHPAHQGHGLGRRLLAHNLARIDSEHAPAYLESSNPANSQLYESVGFAPLEEFWTCDGSHRVQTMWREAR